MSHRTNIYQILRQLSLIVIAAINFFLLLNSNGHAASTRYFKHLKACGGPAEILSMSGPLRQRFCLGKKCSTETLHSYRVRCGDGRIFDAPDLFYRSISDRTRYKLENGRLYGLMTGRVPYQAQECLGTTRGMNEQLRRFGANPLERACYPVTRYRETRQWAAFPAGYAFLPQVSIVTRQVQAAPARAQPVRRQTPQSSGPPIFLFFLLAAAGYLFWKYRQPIMTTYYYYAESHPLDGAFKMATAEDRPLTREELDEAADELRKAARQSPYRAAAIKRQTEDMRKHADDIRRESDLDNYWRTLVDALADAYEGEATNARHGQNKPGKGKP